MDGVQPAPYTMGASPGWKGSLSDRYTRLSDYVGSLPDGLASYAKCQARASLCETLIAAMPAPRPAAADCPPPIDRILAKNATGWMPEVEVMAVSLFIADHFRMSDGHYRIWLKRANESFYSSIVFRALMAFVSPSSVVPRAGARWAAVHKGSQLEGRILSQRSAELVLTFPPRLFDERLLSYFVSVWAAGFEHCKAREAKVSLAKVEPTRAEYAIEWS